MFSAVIPDGFDWTRFHSFLALRRFFGRSRLLVDEGVTFFRLLREVVWSGLTTNVAVDAVYVDVPQAGVVLGLLLRLVCHDLNIEDLRGLVKEGNVPFHVPEGEVRRRQVVDEKQSGQGRVNPVRNGADLGGST